jgi:hypothetical protein
MSWLIVTDGQKANLQSINKGSVRVNVIRSTQGNWIVCDDALAEAVAGGPLELFAEWYAGLVPSSDTPAPRPPRKKT